MQVWYLEFVAEPERAADGVSGQVGDRGFEVVDEVNGDLGAGVVLVGVDGGVNISGGDGSETSVHVAELQGQALAWAQSRSEAK